MNSKEEYVYEISGEIVKIKTAVKSGETYFYLFVEGDYAEVVKTQDVFGTVLSEETIKTEMYCFELKFKDNKAAILLKKGDSVYLESPTIKGPTIPSVLKSFNGLLV